MKTKKIVRKLNQFLEENPIRFEKLLLASVDSKGNPDLLNFLTSLINTKKRTLHLMRDQTTQTPTTFLLHEGRDTPTP